MVCSQSISTQWLGGKKERERGAWRPIYPLILLLFYEKTVWLLDPNHLLSLLLEEQWRFLHAEGLALQGHGKFGEILLAVSSTFPLCYSIFPAFQSQCGLISVVVSLFLQVCDRTLYRWWRVNWACSPGTVGFSERWPHLEFRFRTPRLPCYFKL